MRLVYLCTCDPPPPHSDWLAVQTFFEALPAYLHPRDSKNNSQHTLYFADRVGSDWLPEFHDFAIAFLSGYFLESERAMACLARARTAFPNLVCIDLYNDLTEVQRDTVRQYAKRLFSPDAGKEFLLTTFPQIAAAYDMEKKELTRSIESDGYDYLDQTITELKDEKKRNRIISWVCYALSLSILATMLCFAFAQFGALTGSAPPSAAYAVVLCVESVILSVLTVSVARFLFLLGKAFMVEGIRCADRAHAIGLGKLYLKLYKGNFRWEELKDVLKSWNIDNGSAFRELDAKDIEAVNLDQIGSLFQKGGS